jgi:ATP-dependent Lon protease
LWEEIQGMKKKTIGEQWASVSADLLTGKKTGLLTEEDKLIRKRIEYKDSRRSPLTKRQWRKKLEKIGLPELITKELFDDIDKWKNDDE